MGHPQFSVAGVRYEIRGPGGDSGGVHEPRDRTGAGGCLRGRWGAGRARGRGEPRRTALTGTDSASASSQQLGWFQVSAPTSAAWRKARDAGCRSPGMSPECSKPAAGTPPRTRFPAEPTRPGDDSERPMTNLKDVCFSITPRGDSQEAVKRLGSGTTDHGGHPVHQESRVSGRELLRRIDEEEGVVRAGQNAQGHFSIAGPRQIVPEPGRASVGG
jgi:hypothetical protein